MLAHRILSGFRAALASHREEEAWIAVKRKAEIQNPWFTEDNINQTLDYWYNALSERNVKRWLDRYSIPENTVSKKVGIIMAGNIPLVGMHDLLCTLVCGLDANVKLSSDDEVLPKFWFEKVAAQIPELMQRVHFVERLEKSDLAIATGNNNSARYFEYYFRNIPHILRKNRNSIAVIAGEETGEDIAAIGHDVFDYFGLGCRNVTHLLLPKNYDPTTVLPHWEHFDFLANHNKYINNYNYHKALLLMNLEGQFDSGFLLMKDQKILHSPVGMLNYSFYNNHKEAADWIALNQADIQCVISKGDFQNKVLPGESQNPELWDYADNLDTIAWLLANAK